MSLAFKKRKKEIKRIQKEHNLWRNNLDWKEHYTFKKEKAK